MSSRAAVLEALLDGPGHGRELIDRVAALTEGEVVLNSGGIYRTLRKLHQEGLVLPTSPEEDEYRVPYALTDAGHEVAVEQRRVLGKFFRRRGST